MTRTVTFPAGQTSQTVTVSTLDDSLSEGPENFGASLSSPNGNGLPFSIGDQDTTSVGIVDNEGNQSHIFLLFQAKLASPPVIHNRSYCGV